MRTRAVLFTVYFTLIMILGIFSYGFVDPNLSLSKNPLFVTLSTPLTTLVYHNRPVTVGIFLSILCLLCFLYVFVLRNAEKLFISWKAIIGMLFGISALLVLSYPALSYDLFNYITTAKVVFTYHENPYIVMPIEIPNEPYLAFTRASNKVALYGPVWLLFTSIPHTLGGGHIWQTIIMFKLMNAIAYIGFSYLIYRVTKRLTNVVFFALNPLVLIEVLLSGHNDIYMMLLALGGLIVWKKRGIGNWLAGLSLFFSSWWIKGATVVVTPLFLFRSLSYDRIMVIAYWLLAAVFVFIAPIREELYPWYAVWLIMVAACMDIKKQTFIFGFSIVLSFALELRHIPYMLTGSYGGSGPMLRSLFTIVPVIVFLCVTRGKFPLRKKS
jgi:hypothetical protein